MSALLTRLDGGVLTLTMNRPDKRNAFNLEMMQGLLDALRGVATDPAVKVLVLTGAGDAFCAGGDVAAMAAGRSFGATYEANVDALRQKMEAPRLLHELGKPTIARVRGPAAGAGLALALACDLRIASASAQFVTAFAKVGLSGDYGGSWFLSRLVGVARAKELYYTSPRVGAQEALAIGLVNRIVADAELDATVDALAAQLAAGPSVAFGYMKRNLNAVAEGISLAALLDLEAARMVRSTQTADHREAATAFVEKRAPRFAGE
jgi:2-(1,2-epoxy-1,2-dihydrophenyl)acetyl-CoA isomerase